MEERRVTSRRAFLTMLAAAGAAIGAGTGVTASASGISGSDVTESSGAGSLGSLTSSGSSSTVPVSDSVLNDLVRLGSSISDFVPAMPKLITVPDPSASSITAALTALPSAQLTQVTASAQMLTVGTEPQFASLTNYQAWSRIGQRGAVTQTAQGPVVAPGGVGDAVSLLIAIEAPSVAGIADQLAAIFVGAAGAYQTNLAQSG